MPAGAGPQPPSGLRPLPHSHSHSLLTLGSQRRPAHWGDEGALHTRLSSGQPGAHTHTHTSFLR